MNQRQKLFINLALLSCMGTAMAEHPMSQASSAEPCLSPSQIREHLTSIMSDKAPAVWNCDNNAELMEKTTNLIDRNFQID